jgi:hypothetical protein
MRSRLAAARAFGATCVVLFLCQCYPAGAQETSPASFGTSVVIPSGLRGLIYYIRPGSWSLPDFSRLQPVGVIYTTKLNVPPQNWSFGFPGVTDRFEWFSIDYRGRFWVSLPGNYDFALTSDDGSKLYIDETMVINNDLQHPAQTEFRRIRLNCGIHNIRVSYFQGPRNMLALVLSVSGGGKQRRIFSTEEFKPPENPDDWVCDGVPVPFDPGRRVMPDVPTQRSSQALEDEAMGYLNANPRPQEIAVRSSAFHFWHSATASQTSVTIGVPGTALAVTHVAGPKPVDKVHALVFGIIKAGDGSVLEKFAIDAPYQFTGNDYASARMHNLAFSHPVHLPVGRFTVDVVVIDREGKRAGAVQLAAESPAPRHGIDLSSLVPVDRVEAIEGPADIADPLIFHGKRVVPRMIAEVSGDGTASVYFVVYPDSANSAKPTVRVQFLRGGRLVTEKSAELPPPDATGAIQMFLTLGAVVGEEEVKVVALQGDSTATDSLHYNVRGR